MNRSVLLAVLCAASVARADMGMLPNGGTMQFSKLFIYEDGATTAAEPKIDPDSVYEYFNNAHCVCSQPKSAGEANPDYREDRFEQEVTVMNVGTLSRPLDVWTGTECDKDAQTRMLNCNQLTYANRPSIAAIENGGGTTKLDISTYDLMVTKQQTSCDSDIEKSRLWALVDADSNGDYEFSLSKEYPTDAKPPPAIDKATFAAQGAESAIQLSWGALGDTTDVFAYQALCATTPGGSPAKTKDVPKPLYQTPFTLCGANRLTLEIVDLTGSDTGVDAGLVETPEGISDTNPAFICGETLESTATSLRISGLTNGTSYAVALLVIDKAKNARGYFFNTALAPRPATDFWEDLHDKGSNVQGGFCLLAETYGDGSPLTRALRGFRDGTLARTAFGRWLTSAYYASFAELGAIVHGHLALRIIAGVLLLPLVVLALAWHFLTLPGLLLLGLGAWLFRRRRVLALRFATAGAAFAMFMPAHAQAQTPYWEDYGASNSDTPSDEPAQVTWHLGVRLGPYTPEIDKQTGLNPGPYEQMFGKKYSVMPMLDLDRIILRKFGQLGVGGSIGFIGKSAKAFDGNSDPNDPNRMRSTADETSFRLLPLAATVVYRFTYLDDRWGVPVVPYARGGLAYYIWWINGPNGIAEVCKDGAPMPCSAVDKAYGASFGVVGSVGLAIRAERIDSSAAATMRDSGIEHAGFYGELSLAKVDGFGSDKKLSVGDKTWFAGVSFEF